MAACKQPEKLDPAPYVAPSVGTVYTYAGFKNIVLASDGWRVKFADDRGKKAARVGLFITDDPDTPSQIDTTALAKLWPLATGKAVSVKMKSGDYVTNWSFKVIGQAQVGVDAGVFDTYVVQGVQRPDSISDPKKQTVFAFTWWYAPDIAAVVKFETTYYSGPAAGQVIGSVLLHVDTVSIDTSRVKAPDSSSTKKR